MVQPHNRYFNNHNDAAMQSPSGPDLQSGNLYSYNQADNNSYSPRNNYHTSSNEDDFNKKTFQQKDMLDSNNLGNSSAGANKKVNGQTANQSRDPMHIDKESLLINPTNSSQTAQNPNNQSPDFISQQIEAHTATEWASRWLFTFSMITLSNTVTLTMSILAIAKENIQVIGAMCVFFFARYCGYLISQASLKKLTTHLTQMDNENMDFDQLRQGGGASGPNTGNIGSKQGGTAQKTIEIHYVSSSGTRNDRYVSQKQKRDYLAPASVKNQLLIATALALIASFLVILRPHDRKFQQFQEVDLTEDPSSFYTVMLFTSAILLGISTGMTTYSLTLYADCCPSEEHKKYVTVLRPLCFSSGCFLACVILGIFPRYGIVLLLLQIGTGFVAFCFRELNYVDRLEITRLIERTKNVEGLTDKITNESLLPRSRWQQLKQMRGETPVPFLIFMGIISYIQGVAILQSSTWFKAVGFQIGGPLCLLPLKNNHKTSFGFLLTFIGSLLFCFPEDKFETWFMIGMCFCVIGFQVGITGLAGLTNQMSRHPIDNFGMAFVSTNVGQAFGCIIARVVFKKKLFLAAVPYQITVIVVMATSAMYLKRVQPHAKFTLEAQESIFRERLLDEKEQEERIMKEQQIKVQDPYAKYNSLDSVELVQPLPVAATIDQQRSATLMNSLNSRALQSIANQAVTIDSIDQQQNNDQAMARTSARLNNKDSY